MSEAIGTDGFSVTMLDNGTDSVAVYGIYSYSGKPLRILLINTEYFGGVGLRPSTTISISNLETNLPVLSAKRLTAPSATSVVFANGSSPITLAGQVFNTECSPIGSEIIELIRVSDGSAAVALGASESLIVWLH